MPWDDADASLLAFYVELGRLRRSTAGLWRRPREVVALDDGAGLFAWRCDDGAAGALVALNNGDGEVELEVDPSPGWSLALASADGVRLAAGRLVLPPVAGAILVRGTPPAIASGAGRIEVR